MAKNRILVVEDDTYIAENIGINLDMSGYDYRIMDDGLCAAEHLKNDHSYDLALLDVMLPGIDGFALMEHMQKYNIPALYLTAKSDLPSRVKGLKGGAEDYIVKPFEMLEVMVRLEKVLDRYGTAPKQIQIDDVIIDTVSHIVTKNGEEIYLKPMEYNCLMVFVKNPNKALTRSQILQELWKEEFCGETRTVDAHVGRIRKKLSWQDKIKTIPRIGYRLEVDL